MAKRKKRQARRFSRKKAVQNSPKRWHALPLKSSFMAASILGFLITVYLIYPESPDYGLAFMVVFSAMFIASLISMTRAPMVE